LNLDLESPRYLRLSVREGANISDAVGRVLVESGVCVRSVLQKSDSGSTGSVLVMILESCPVSILEVALKRLKELIDCLASAVTLPIMS
jgi:hypothetical protein